MHHTSLHFHHPRHADLFEDFCSHKLPSDEIFIPQQHQPLNPEDEDDVVPDQHAAFGITRATQSKKETAWKDLGLAELMRKGPQSLVEGEGGMARKAGSVFGGKKTMPR